jgi:hypothetical protein
MMGKWSLYGVAIGVGVAVGVGVWEGVCVGVGVVVGVCVGSPVKHRMTSPPTHRRDRCSYPLPSRPGDPPVYRRSQLRSGWLG